ncbi:glutathione S-transferase [Pseudooceanicola spongiae]|uniref:Glutathione S-transferase n=1 Tax=Pseudooceanicola spongiae TaxID=2613965 RepID=A0A7L9WQ46_9RHOB|nr:glutathione S-transferase [Pseudooceanicola spongiae]QOL81974.1 glutathione S-transferase [Pseudooceanicola spongiae]
MADFTLYYWPIPFRGQFVRATLAHVGASWDEAGFDETFAQRASDPAAQKLPHMGPPVLVDHQRDCTLSQMPAILSYLGEVYRLTGCCPDTHAICLKVICDANDVLYEMTRYNGAQFWSDEAWAEFLPRLARWMGIFEEVGARHGLSAGEGYVLGTDAPGLADLVVATLWGTMTARFAPLRGMLDAEAPGIAGLTDRIRALPEQAALIRQSDAAYGEVWCGGQIEESLRRVLRS